MQRPLIPRPIRQQILPEDRIPLERAKRDALVPVLVTIDKPAPPLVRGRIDHREVGAAPRRPVGDVHVGEETRRPVPAHVRAGVGRVGVPVRVEVEVLAHAVLDQLDRLEVAAGHVEALELEGAVLYAPHDGVAGDIG